MTDQIQIFHPELPDRVRHIAKKLALQAFPHPSLENLRNLKALINEELGLPDNKSECAETRLIGLRLIRVDFPIVIEF